MIYNNNRKQIILDREINVLDKFVIDFVRLLGDNYVIVSGYVSILTGRSRATEDVDLLIPPLRMEEFRELWKKIEKAGFECANTTDSMEAYEMLNQHAIRFFAKGKPVPNMEFKTIKDDLGNYSFTNKIKVIIGKNILYVSPLEMQIPYKLFLAANGTDDELIADKDIEDARHLYKMFKDKINKREMLIFVNKLNVQKRMRLLE